jgi:4-carboxymuconolactone decarboxylase
MSRLRELRPSDLDAEQQAFLELIFARGGASGDATAQAGLRADSLRGLSSARLRSPGIGAVDQAFGESLRRNTSLTGRMRDLVASLVGAATQCRLEVDESDADTYAAPLAKADLAGLKARSVPSGLAPDEAVAVRCALALVGDGRPDGGDLDDALFGEAVAALGERALYELVVVVGYYLRLALQQRVFRIGLVS